MPNLSREEALEVAVAVVEKLGNTPDLNARGYKVDGWKPPTVEERVAAILAIAGFLVRPTGPAVPPLSPEHVHNGSTANEDWCACGAWWNAKVSRWETRDRQEQHVHRASCDDAGGNHMCGYR